MQNRGGILIKDAHGISIQHLLLHPPSTFEPYALCFIYLLLVGWQSQCKHLSLSARLGLVWLVRERALRILDKCGREQIEFTFGADDVYLCLFLYLFNDAFDSSITQQKSFRRKIDEFPNRLIKSTHTHLTSNSSKSTSGEEKKRRNAERFFFFPRMGIE